MEIKFRSFRAYLEKYISLKFSTYGKYLAAGKNFKKLYILGYGENIIWLLDLLDGN